MIQAFQKKKFSPEAADIVRFCIGVIEKYKNAGYKLSLRQLYYQCVAANVVPNTEQSYDRVGGIITDARMAGLCDWDMIEDRNRECVIPSHWASPQEIIDTCAKSYRIDRWATQPDYCEVMVEKQALEGVLEPVCNSLDVPFTANKGYSSVTMMYNAGQRIMRKFRERCAAKGLMPKAYEDKRAMFFNEYLAKADYFDANENDSGFSLNEKGREVGLPRMVVFYMGDHDPSGIDMTRDVADRLKIFSDYTPIEVVRLALNMVQIDELNPPENPAKMSDSRAKDYVEKFGRSSWELDAVEPDAMAQMVRDAITGVIDEKTWRASYTRQNSEIQILKGLAATAEQQAAELAAKKKKGKK